MKTIVLALVLTAITTAAAYAACPAGTKYQCYTSLNGKVVCGCF